MSHLKVIGNNITNSTVSSGQRIGFINVETGLRIEGKNFHCTKNVDIHTSYSKDAVFFFPQIDFPVTCGLE